MPRRKKKRRRRTRSPHPGVVILQEELPSGTIRHYARWVDPIEGKRRKQSFEVLEITNEDARVAWAKDKSAQVADVKRRLSTGELCRLPEITLADSVKDYLNRAEERLKAVTIAGYRGSLAYFQGWAKGARIERLDQLDRAALARFKDWMRRQPKRAAVAKGKRGERRSTGAKLSASSVNHHLAQVRVYLHEQRRHGLLRKELDRDAISEALAKTRAPLARPAYLRPADLKALLQAALRHDRATFEMTRAEKNGGGDPGETQRYEPISPLVLLAVLGGFRFKELTHLEWSWVHLDARQPEVIIPASSTKTGHERAVGLAETPTLIRLLSALTLQGSGPWVFGGAEPITRDRVEAARRRLQRHFAAPPFTWQQLRQTCASYSSNARSLWGDASAFASAKRLGHSVLVAEKRYAGLVQNLPDESTLEGVMGISELAAEIVGLVASPERRRRAG